ncbi:unnamed protein product [Symbiodinium sp. CCMP2592]|nr:unnamed protein product [Symbiodinium sp. CCMP2592]
MVAAVLHVDTRGSACLAGRAEESRASSRSQTPLGRPCVTGPCLPQASASYVPVAVHCTRMSSPFLRTQDREFSPSVGWHKDGSRWTVQTPLQATAERRTLSVGGHRDPFCQGRATTPSCLVRRPPLPQAPAAPVASRASAPSLQAFPQRVAATTLSCPAMTANRSPHLVSRGSFPSALRGQVGATAANTMSTPNLPRAEPQHLCAMRSRSYTPDPLVPPLVPWPVQQTPRAQICVLPNMVNRPCSPFAVALPTGPCGPRCSSSPPTQVRPSASSVSPRRGLYTVAHCDPSLSSASHPSPPPPPPPPTARFEPLEPEQKEDSELPKCAAGVEFSVGGKRYRCRSVLGRGSFSEVWSGEVVSAADNGGAVALKDIFCKTKADLEQTLFEVSLLERFKEAASDGREAPMRIPRYFGHKVDQKEEGWRVCLAMARLPGECLDAWLRRPPPPNQDGPSAVRRGCALAMALIRQLGPTLERLAPHAWHRDVNSHNVLLSDADGGRLTPCSDVEETSKRARFWLLDFGLAVDAATWPQRWPHSDVAGDCRYWATSSFVMSFCGPEETSAKRELCSQYKTKLDVVGLGLTALELLCSSALASRESWGPANGLRGSWERLLETWERYREDVTRWHAMIFQVFAKGGDIAPLYRQLGQADGVHVMTVHVRLPVCTRKAAFHKPAKNTAKEAKTTNSTK